jgi:hypothetical protein
MSSVDALTLSRLWEQLKKRLETGLPVLHDELLQDLLERVEALEKAATVAEPPPPAPNLKTRLTILIAQRCQTVRAGQSYEPIACAVLELVADWLDSSKGLPDSATSEEAGGWDLAANVLYSEAHR